MRITLITPRIAVQKGDFLGSGVPYWPVELATLAAHLRQHGEAFSVIDLFGGDPARLSEQEDHYLQGVPLDGHLRQPWVAHAEAFILFAISYMSHQELLGITRLLKQLRPGIPIAVLENSQAVTAYSLQRVAPAFFEAGADLLICGEALFNWAEISAYLTAPATAPVPDNVVTRTVRRAPQRKTVKTARYPVPAWDLFNLEGYWALPYSHGPKTGRFLPMLTSRGCPYPCDFCVVPETNNRRFRGNAPQDVVEEIITLRDRFGVRDFQIEDLNPTADAARWPEICRLLLERDAGVRFYIVSGTKAETVPIAQIPLLAQAGCRYLSISPESGSSRLMKVIGKSFDHDHGAALIAACRAAGIRTQACFLVGHPAETDQDFELSHAYLKRLVRAGLDEVAVFIVAAFAGSALYAQNRIAVDDPGALPSFSPKGRPEHLHLAERRQRLIRLFFWEKLQNGLDLWMQGVRSVVGTPQTKMENLPRRMAYISWLALKSRLPARTGANA